MGYIVTAQCYLHAEMNMHADATKVDARILSNANGYITFDVKGEFGREAEIVGKLVETLLAAGYYEFSINHSY